MFHPQFYQQHDEIKEYESLTDLVPSLVQEGILKMTVHQDDISSFNDKHKLEIPLRDNRLVKF